MLILLQTTMIFVMVETVLSMFDDVSCLDMAMRCTPDISQSPAHHKNETLCFDVFTHEWNNLQEHCD